MPEEEEGLWPWEAQAVAEVQRHQAAVEVEAALQEEPGTAEEGRQPWEARATAAAQRR